MLEAILAAEDGLVVTYSGYDPQTGAEQPAAAPIDELMMVVQSSFTVPTDCAWTIHFNRLVLDSLRSTGRCLMTHE